MAAPRFVVGVDLGTTNTACAWVDTQAGRTIGVFEVPQLVAPGEMGARPTLPSFVYLAGAHDLPPGSLDLPWTAGRDFCVGLLAREQGGRVPGRLVASAKSWLCHGGVDRTAAILPWGAGEGVPRVSPVEASARILRHLREAWDASFPEPLAAQEVVLTVPASFDEVARELTLAAAREAGFPDVVLLEEPQAAFYAWLVAHEQEWRPRVAAHPLVLVIDVGGGTTDLSLIAARASRGELGLERVAVGEHLLLGGDNMDIALARAVEPRLSPGRPLDSPRFHALVSRCRAAKEELLADASLTDVRISVPGRGAGVVGGALAATLSRTEVEAVVLDGFFPPVGGEARPRPAAALCIVPRGMEEGESVEIADRELELLANRPVAFPLYTATDRSGERAGELVRAAPDALSPLPPLRTVVRFGRKLAERALPVHLEVRLTEIGTLELWCRSLETEHRWRLEFRLRDIVSPAAEPAAAGDVALVVEPARLDEASALLRAAFERGDDPVTLTRRLEAALAAGRDAWPLAAIRTLWDALWPLEPARARSAEHEARWLNLAGFLLRPGFGDAGDEVRVGRLWRVLSGELRHPRAVQCRAEWWNLWKRIAGGLTARQQQHLLELVGPALLRRGKPRGPRPAPQERREMGQAVGSCERLPAAARAELGGVLVAEAERGPATEPELWALARLGARGPVYGPLNCVVARAAAAAWTERLLAAAGPRPEAYAFALAQLARATGDRGRDLDPELRERLARRLETAPHGERAARIVREPVALEAREEARLLDETLPAGLRLRGDV